MNFKSQENQQDPKFTNESQKKKDKRKHYKSQAKTTNQIPIKTCANKGQKQIMKNEKKKKTEETKLGGKQVQQKCNFTSAELPRDSRSTTFSRPLTPLQNSTADALPEVLAAATAAATGDGGGSFSPLIPASLLLLLSVAVAELHITTIDTQPNSVLCICMK